MIEAYGAGNGQTGVVPRWFDHGERAGGGRRGDHPVRRRLGSWWRLRHWCGSPRYRGGPALDMTFEASITKLMVLLDRYSVDEVRQLMQQDLAGELTTV